jgi:hypothetical protein
LPRGLWRAASRPWRGSRPRSASCGPERKRPDSLGVENVATDICIGLHADARIPTSYDVRLAETAPLSLPPFFPPRLRS